jgi:hypothetical protein
MNLTNTRMNVNKPSTMNSINKKLDSVYNSVNVNSPKFGGGIFDWLLGKPTQQPVVQQHLQQPVVQQPVVQQPVVQQPVVQQPVVQQPVVQTIPRPANVVKRNQTPLTTKGVFSGGYKPTKRNLKTLRKYKKGKSIGFTMRSSLKAKGLIPRANGSYRVSKKYRG